MNLERIIGRLRFFLRSNDGLVTLEWVVIAAAVIIIGVAVIIILKPSVDVAASSVGSNILSSVNSGS